MSTDAISPLRQRMIEDMSARQLSPPTQKSHIRACKRFVVFLKRSPDTATADDIRRFQLHLAESGITICHRNRTITGLKFLFRVTLRRLDLAAAPHLPRFRALALLGRLPSARVDGAPCRLRETCTGRDSCTAANKPLHSITPSAVTSTVGLIGNAQEMTANDIYEAIERCPRRKKAHIAAAAIDQIDERRVVQHVCRRVCLPGSRIVHLVASRDAANLLRASGQTDQARVE